MSSLGPTDIHPQHIKLFQLPCRIGTAVCPMYRPDLEIHFLLSWGVVMHLAHLKVADRRMLRIVGWRLVKFGLDLERVPGQLKYWEYFCMSPD